MTPLFRRLLSATLLATALPCFAQFGGGMGGMGGGMGGGPPGRRAEAPSEGAARSGPPDLASAAAQLRDRLLDMRLLLAITPEQAPAWSRFSDAVWKLASHRGIRPAPPAEGQSVAQGLRLRAQQAQESAAQLAGLAAALEGLYAVLAPAQQRLADTQLAGAFP